MPGALTLADVFSAEAAEAPYQRLVAVLNRHEAALERLHARLDAIEAAQEATELSTRELEARAIVPLADRVSELERTTKRDQEALARESQEQLVDLQSALKQKCDRHELAEAIERAERATIKLGLEVRAEAASFELVNSLQTDQRLLHERVATMDRRLETKIDKTEGSWMDAALAQIREFRPVAAQLTARVGELEAQQVRVAEDLQANAAQLRADAAELSRLGNDINSSRRVTTTLEREVHDELIPQLQGTVEMLERLNGAVSASEALANSLETALRTLSAKFHAFASSTTDSARQVAINLEAARNELGELHSQASQKWIEIARSIERTATSEALNELHELVDQLADRSEALERHATLSARFLDWFASRGEAHEHNLRLVETQLGRIAHGSDPRRREPFSGGVRFPRSS